MDSLDTQALVRVVGAVAAAIEADKARLSALDGTIGDGDHGVTMALGFGAVVKALAAAPPPDPAGVFNVAAKAFLNAVGASSGPLYATAFMRAGAQAKGLATLDADAVVAALAAMARGMQDRGKAQRGEKTMLDAWLPAADAAGAARAGGASLADCLQAAADAAAEGAEATKAMPALKGRAARLGTRALGHIDPGAASAALILHTMADAVRD